MNQLQLEDIQLLMNSKRQIARNAQTLMMPKTNRKYVPSPEETKIIVNYFLHNNFQDFNTWQQISKSKCQFEYSEAKSQNFECKVVLKWDDPSMPMIVQIGASRNKKNAKKKALHKLIENLIFLGLIGYGFKETDFIKKLPKRRKQSSDESSTEICDRDTKIQQMIAIKDYQEALNMLNYKNFDKLLCASIKEQNLVLYLMILRKLQNINNKQGINTGFNKQDINQNQKEMYNSVIQLDPYHLDLSQTLNRFELKLVTSGQNKQNQTPPHQMDLPCLKFSNPEGKISFQFFNPIEFTLIFRRNTQQIGSQQRIKQRSDYFNDFYKQIELPKFESEDLVIPLPYKVIQKILNIILEFSYNYRLVVNLLSIFEREVQLCQLEPNTDLESQSFFLKQIILVTVEFAYLLFRKTQMLSLSIQGLISIQAGGCLNFIAKEPQEILAKKISKKLNTNQIEQMSEFASQQFVLLVSKIDSNMIYIAQIVQCWPSIKMKCISFQTEEDKDKLPFTMYKISNAKLYNRLTRSIVHTAKNRYSKIRSNCFVIQQKPTHPILILICQLLSEWTALTETVLIVSDNYAEIFAHLSDRGFKAIKITQKIDQKSIIKKQIVCCSPAGVCSDAIKNYAYTRVIIQGAQRVPVAMTTLALDKGYKKVYLIGDSRLPSSLALTNYGKNRSMPESLFTNLINQGVECYNFSQDIEPNYLDVSILYMLNKLFYFNRLNIKCGFESPSIKGFPWPSQTSRVAFIQVDQEDQLKHQIDICCEIVVSVIKSGFITINEIACRVTSANWRASLTSNLYNTFKKYNDLGVNPQLVLKAIDFVTGSKFKQRSLCILAGDSQELKVQHAIAGLQEGRRGFILLADFTLLKDRPEWLPLLQYVEKNKLFLSKNDENRYSN